MLNIYRTFRLSSSPCKSSHSRPPRFLPISASPSRSTLEHPLPHSASSLFPCRSQNRHDTPCSHNLRDLIIDPRSLVLPPPTNEIPDNTKYDDTTGHNNRVVHCGRRHRGLWWPHRPEDDKDHIYTCVCIVDRSQNSGNMPRTPGQWCLGDGDAAVIECIRD